MAQTYHFESELRQCTRCHDWLPLDQFGTYQKPGGIGIRTICNPCRAADARKRYKTRDYPVDAPTATVPAEYRCEPVDALYVNEEYPTPQQVRIVGVERDTCNEFYYIEFVGRPVVRKCRTGCVWPVETIEAA